MQRNVNPPSRAGSEVRRLAGRGLPCSTSKHFPAQHKPQRPNCARQTPQGPHTLDKLTFQYALKEWAPACAALQSGEQLVIHSWYSETKLPCKALEACSCDIIQNARSSEQFLLTPCKETGDLTCQFYPSLTFTTNLFGILHYSILKVRGRSRCSCGNEHSRLCLPTPPQSHDLHATF